VSQRVLCPYTALLVLPTEQDYTRYGINRNALVDILVVGENGVSLLSRNSPIIPTNLSETDPVDRDESNDNNQIIPTDTLFASSGGRLSPFKSFLDIANGIFYVITFFIKSAFSFDKITYTPLDLQKLKDKLSVSYTRGDFTLYALALKANQDWNILLQESKNWLKADPLNIQVYEFISISAYNLGNQRLAIKAATSIAEISPSSDTELGRTAYLLLMIKEYTWARHFFYRALEQKNDQQNYYRGLGITEMLAGNFSGAEQVYLKALSITYLPAYGDVHRVFREELAYVYNAWINSYPNEKNLIENKANSNQINLNYGDKLRVTVSWQTDANDVDLHIIDPLGEECYYGRLKVASGLELYRDILRGYGPEVIVTKSTVKGRYRIGVKYFSSGSMGTSRGVVIIFVPDYVTRVSDPTIIPFTLDQNAGGTQFITDIWFQ